jgi:FAD/FMN-containing dehydrogenase
LLNPVIDEQGGRTWQNWHSTRGVGGPVTRFLTPHNVWEDGSTTPGNAFAPGLAALQSIIQRAESEGTQVRALGSGWSLSSAPFVGDNLVNTARLSNWFVGFKTPTLVDPAMRDSAQQLVFTQCGNQIKSLNSFLEASGLALPTSGASNGQTIVGAMSTGTHGSAHDVGSIADYMLGLHLVAEGGKHYWIERPSRPTMSQAFADWLGAKFIRDEDLFLAAVVGFGSFGLIHAVMFKAEPLYLLELFVKQFDFADVRNAICTRDPTGLGLPDGPTMPFHFEVVINPYKLGAGDGGAFVRVLYKRPLTGMAPSPPPTDGFNILSRDLVSIAGHFSDAFPGAVPSFLQNQLVQSLHPTAPDTVLASPGVQFGDSQPTNGGTSIEVSVPLSRVSDALDVILSVTAANVFGAPLAFRYLRASDALLAPTWHSPTACAMEMPGIDSDLAAKAHQLIFAALAAKGIPATYHWGQQGPYNNKSIIDGYGSDRVNRWLAARRNFLSPPGRAMFSNPLLTACGLDT